LDSKNFIYNIGGDWVLVIDKIQIARFPTKEHAEKQLYKLTKGKSNG
tara:strand:- start:247 stop:387 length:141 start_codon:yes stop_codon:yes gene_type:complete